MIMLDRVCKSYRTKAGRKTVLDEVSAVFQRGVCSAEPSEEALYPRRFRDVGTALFLCCAVWLIGPFAVQIMREHL